MYNMDFLQKFQDQFLPELARRIDEYRKGSRIIHIEEMPMGLYITLEDPSGRTATFYINPIHLTWLRVYDAR